MLKVIRRKVFETNSSSTHSISIYKWTPTKESSIPLNTKIIIDGTISSQTEIKDELGKLNYIVAILASVEENRQDYEKTEATFEEVINSNHFTWLKEVIKEKCNTDVIYQSDNNCFPYFETTYDESISTENILECDIDNKLEFKSRIKEIIFEENYVIEDKENDY